MRSHGRPRNCDRPTFPIENEWGIPALLPEMLATPRMAKRPLFTYRSAPLIASSAKDKLVSFFVDDYRFSVAWSYPDRLLGHMVSAKVAAAFEPNFSVWRDAPRAEQLHAIYRQRWCARYWQEAGIPVIPVLNWSDVESYCFAFLGIPQRAPVIAIQSRTVSKADRGHFNAGLLAAIAATQPQSLLIYGDTGRDWISLPRGLPVRWIKATTDSRFDRLRRLPTVP